MIALILAATIYAGNASRDAYVMAFGDSPSISLNTSGIGINPAVKMRERYGRDFLWVRRNGREYVIRDRALLATIDALFSPQRELEPQQRTVDREESELDHEIDALEDRDEDDKPLTAAEETRLRDLRARERDVSARQRDLDRREEELERKAERQLWRMVDDAIRKGIAVRD
jgi:hypothetical protein